MSQPVEYSRNFWESKINNWKLPQYTEHLKKNVSGITMPGM